MRTFYDTSGLELCEVRELLGEAIRRHKKGVARSIDISLDFSHPEVSMELVEALYSINNNTKLFLSKDSKMFGNIGHVVAITPLSISMDVTMDMEMAKEDFDFIINKYNIEEA